MMTMKRLGAGRVVFMNGAVEVNASIDGWPAYAEAAEVAGVKRLVRGDNPSVGFTEHSMNGVTYVVAVNYKSDPVNVNIECDGTISRTFGSGSLKDGVLSLGANNAVVIEINGR